MMKKMNATKFISLLTVLVALLVNTHVHAVQIQDITRLKGSESSTITAYGLVVGLNGTGDGGKFDVTNRALAQTIAHLTDETVTASEMAKSKNVALVALTAQIPESGVREGDKIDVQVSAVGSAKSLQGGSLFLSPMIGPYPNAPIFAMASGKVEIDPNTPTSGVVIKGAQLTRDIMTRFMDDYGYITLVLDDQHAYMDVAVLIAEQINAEYNPDDFANDTNRSAQIAKAIDAKNVRIQVPHEYRGHVAEFVAKIQSIFIPTGFIRGKAKVYINKTTQTICIDGAVQISPVGISNKGLKITTITPAPKPSEFNPTVEEKDWYAAMPKNDESAQLQDLIDIFNQIKTPDEDRIAIIEAMHKSGNIHAELIIE